MSNEFEGAIRRLSDDPNNEVIYERITIHRCPHAGMRQQTIVPVYTPANLAPPATIQLGVVFNVRLSFAQTAEDLPVSTVPPGFQITQPDPSTMVLFMRAYGYNPYDLFDQAELGLRLTTPPAPPVPPEVFNTFDLKFKLKTGLASNIEITLGVYNDWKGISSAKYTIIKTP